MDMVFLKKMEKNGRVKEFEHTWRILQKKPKATAAFGFLEAEWMGFEPMRPERTTAFRVRLVMTSSIPLQK